jgi:hypothetical protein
LKSSEIQNYLYENLTGIELNEDIDRCDGCDRIITEDTIIKAWSGGKREKIEYTCCSSKCAMTFLQQFTQSAWEKAAINGTKLKTTRSTRSRKT